MDKEERLLGITEAARIIHVSPQYLRRLCRAGEVKAQKVGNVWMIRKSALRARIMSLQEKADGAGEREPQVDSNGDI